MTRTRAPHPKAIVHAEQAGRYAVIADRLSHTGETMHAAVWFELAVAALMLRLDEQHHATHLMAYGAYKAPAACACAGRCKQAGDPCLS